MAGDSPELRQGLARPGSLTQITRLSAVIRAPLTPKVLGIVVFHKVTVSLPYSVQHIYFSDYHFICGLDSRRLVEGQVVYLLDVRVKHLENQGRLRRGAESKRTD